MLGGHMTGSLVGVLGIALFMIVSTSALPTTRQDKEYFKLEDLVPAQSRFIQKSFNGSWASETEILYWQNGSDIYIFDAATQTSNFFMSGAQMMDVLNTTSVTLSTDKASLLARSDPQQEFRHSSTARYAIYDIQSAEIVKISNHERLQFCQFIGETNNSVVFVKQNNLYVKYGLDGEEIQITTDGVPGVIYNGIPDWVYEEEVLSSGSAVWFSPSYTRIAFASFNDTLVDEVSYMTYGQPGSLKDQYAEVIKLRYPKVGRTNPTVTLRVSNLQQGNDFSTVDIPAPIDEVTEDHVLYTVSWISENELAVVWTNRRQNKAVTVICHPETGACEKDLVREEPEGWMEVKTPLFSKDGQIYIDIEPVTPEGLEEWDQWYHLVRYTKGGNVKKSPTPLTIGRKTVSSLVAWNEESDRIYYLATRENRPWEQHLYVLSNGINKCISCDVYLPGGDVCTYATASAPAMATYYTLICQTDGNPAVTAVYDSESDNLVYIWEDNSALRELLPSYYMPQHKIMELPIYDGVNATVQFYLPPELDMESSSEKYKMVVDIYTGPNSVRIYDRFMLGYLTYVSTNRSVIYCKIDGRGTGNKGKNVLFSINNRLGTYEVEDIIEATKVLTQQFNWIDEKHIGLWGWSYGGYATAMALTKDDSHVFKCGLSVAPVTSWLYYDTIYTERYMGLPTPEDNLQGYEASDITKRANNMSTHHWMLIHGNADDNVHYQNAMAMARSLQLLNIPFETMSYPDEAHGLSGTLKHVYFTIDHFWTTCFIGE